MTRDEKLIKHIDRALSAAKDIRNAKGREADVAWKTLTDALLDMRTMLRKPTAKDTVAEDQ
ncbi:MAG: hypothetical protein WC718_00080 [Phycisphaerales bacterium]|jgi:hypothetical protein